MMILNTTMDLIDAIANRDLKPIPYSGRFMYGQDCVACVVDHGSDMDGLPKAGATVDQMGKGYVVYWPGAEWTEGVQEYVDTIYDPSGKAE
jgi:hypothetical protein